MKNFLYALYRFFQERKHNKNIQTNVQFQENRIKAEIIRNVHSIEKGLSIGNPRPGFGIAKIKEMFNLADKYIEITEDKTVLFFVIDAVKAYLEFQHRVGFHSADIDQIERSAERLDACIGKHEGVRAGTIIYNVSDLTCSVEQMENLFNTRHSVRDFSGEKVSEEIIRRAISLAQRAPSACNRQAVRVYSISPERYIQLAGNLDGIGGFAQDVDRFLLITGIESAYRRGEPNQFTVSAAMFGGYLTLALHGLGVGSCVIQRSLFPDKTYMALRKALGIPEDEQTVVMLGIGMMKTETSVPVSCRLPVDQIYKNLGDK